MTKKEKEEWAVLYDYVKVDVLGYKDKVLPRQMVLRLKGLANGKFMANSKVKSNGEYTFNQILLAFKLSRAKIDSYMMSTSFENESHKVNGIMLFVEQEINNVVDMLKRKESMKEKVEATNLEHHCASGAEYKKKSSGINERLKGLL